MKWPRGLLRGHFFPKRPASRIASETKAVDACAYSDISSVSTNFRVPPGCRRFQENDGEKGKRFESAAVAPL